MSLLIDGPVTASQTHKTGYFCAVKDIIQQDSRDQEFVGPETKKAENATVWYSGVTCTFQMFCIYLIVLYSYNCES